MPGVFTTCTVMYGSGARTGMMKITTLRRQRATRATRTVAARTESTAGAAGATKPRSVAPRTGTGLRRTIGTSTLAFAQFWPVQLQASKRSAALSARGRGGSARAADDTSRSEAAKNSPPLEGCPLGAGWSETPSIPNHPVSLRSPPFRRRGIGQCPGETAH